MFWFDFIIALSVAALISSLFAAVLGSRHRPRAEPDARGAVGTALLSFVIVLLATWAGGSWLHPLDPVLWRGHVLPFVLVGVVVALAAPSPTDDRWRGRSTTLSQGSAAALTPEVAREERDAAAALRGVSLFFWSPLAVLTPTIVFGDLP